MLDRRSSGPSDQIFDPEELRVLEAWFAGSSGHAFDSLFDGWGIDAPHPAFRRIDAAVATILHDWIQLRHPRLGATLQLERLATGQAIYSTGDPVPANPAIIVPLARPLFALAWPHSDRQIASAMMYWAVPIPGANKIVLTISLDNPGEGDSTTVAIGWITTESSGVDSVGELVVKVWSRWRNEFRLPRWARILEQDLPCESSIIEGWADLVWSNVAHN
jgi:hypothetical protein